MTWQSLPTQTAARNEVAGRENGAEGVRLDGDAGGRFHDERPTASVGEASSVATCFLCGTCTAGCPLSDVMDQGPHAIVWMLRVGLEDKALSSRSIWLCSSCGTCSARCPNGIDVMGVLEGLRRRSLASRAATGAPEIAAFHRTFVGSIRRAGRINELRLVFQYKLRTLRAATIGSVRADIRRGLTMLLKGKFSLWNDTGGAKEEIRRLFKRSRACL